jgi:hypothetical protein
MTNEDIERIKAIREAAGIENTREAAPPPPPVRQLSGGDAGVVIGLLVFILAWVGGCVWGLVVTTDSADYKDIEWWVAAIMIFIVVGPALWASNMIKHIIGKED